MTLFALVPSVLMPIGYLRKLTSLAVVNDQRQPVGLLHRDQLTEVFAAPYGHALFDKSQCSN